MASLTTANRSGVVGTIVSIEDQARADLYALIAVLLLQPPSPSLLAGLATAAPMPTDAEEVPPLAHAWSALTRAAAGTDVATAVEQVDAEFTALFISVGTPVVNPYASHYMTGFLMEKPLAALRDDLAAIGLGRAAGQHQLEDHLGALCEVMRVLIVGSARLPCRSLQVQRNFFLQHLAPWYGRCLDDIRCVDGTRFYRCLADFVQAFFAVEFQAFEMEDDWREAEDTVDL